MEKEKNQNPDQRLFSTACRRHGKPSGYRAYVQLSGQRVQLGAWNSPESKERYKRVIAEWKASGEQLPAEKDEITVMELSARYWIHAQTYYRHPDGTPTSEVEAYRAALRP